MVSEDTVFTTICPESLILCLSENALLCLLTGASGTNARLIFRSPKQEEEFWLDKIEKDVLRDRKIDSELTGQGVDGPSGMGT